jgi:hypothetical protein
MKWLLFQRGRRIGRKDVVVGGARGLQDDELVGVLRVRAAGLRGGMRPGFWYGVREMRPNWPSADVQT